MSIMVKFAVSGIDTPLPPATEFPQVPKMGDEIRYINPDGNTYSVISHIFYEIDKNGLFAVVELETKKSHRG